MAQNKFLTLISYQIKDDYDYVMKEKKKKKKTLKHLEYTIHNELRVEHKHHNIPNNELALIF